MVGCYWPVGCGRQDTAIASKSTWKTPWTPQKRLNGSETCQHFWKCILTWILWRKVRVDLWKFQDRNTKNTENTPPWGKGFPGKYFCKKAMNGPEVQKKCFWKSVTRVLCGSGSMSQKSKNQDKPQLILSYRLKCLLVFFLVAFKMLINFALSFSLSGFEGLRLRWETAKWNGKLTYKNVALSNLLV